MTQPGQDRPDVAVEQGQDPDQELRCLARRDPPRGVGRLQRAAHVHHRHRPRRRDEPPPRRFRPHQRPQMHLGHVADIDDRQPVLRQHRVAAFQQPLDKPDRGSVLPVQRRAQHETGVDRGQLQMPGLGQFPGGPFRQGLRLAIGRGRRQMHVAPVRFVLQRVQLGFVDHSDHGRGQDHPLYPRGRRRFQHPFGALYRRADQDRRVLGLRDRKGRGGVDQRADTLERLGPTGVRFQVGLHKGQLPGALVQMRGDGGAHLLGPVQPPQSAAHRITRVQ